MTSTSRLCNLVNNVYLEETVSQICYLGLKCYSMSKNGKLFVIFFNLRIHNSGRSVNSIAPFDIVVIRWCQRKYYV